MTSETSGSELLPRWCLDYGGGVSPLDADVAAIARLGGVPDLLKVVSEVTGLRLSLVARVTDDMWKACAVVDRLGFGLNPGDHLDLSTTLCREVRLARTPIVIAHASLDPVYCEHPTPKQYGFESYISVPIIRASGDYFGNLCALDSRPAPILDDQTLPLLTLFAQLIGLQLDAAEQQQRDQVALSDARQVSELREQFIAVLGHDLRNPLAAIMAGADLLARRLTGAERGIAERIRASGARASRLIDDVVDFARGRLGGGVELNLAEANDLDVDFDHVVAELRQSRPGRVIRITHGPVQPFRGDRDRLAQVLSNLVANALDHGQEGEAIDVAVSYGPAALSMSVTNRGEPIPDELRPLLFEPYRRGVGGRSSSGLGLGLYIVASIVRSHGGGVEVRSSRAEGTTFVCTMPHARG